MAFGAISANRAPGMVAASSRAIASGCIRSRAVPMTSVGTPSRPSSSIETPTPSREIFVSSAAVTAIRLARKETAQRGRFIGGRLDQPLRHGRERRNRASASACLNAAAIRQRRCSVADFPAPPR